MEINNSSIASRVEPCKELGNESKAMVTVNMYYSLYHSRLGSPIESVDTVYFHSQNWSDGVQSGSWTRRVTAEMLLPVLII